MDHLVKLVDDARRRGKRGYYDCGPTFRRSRKGLSRAIQEARSNPIITEIKFASPSQGRIRGPEPAAGIAKEMVDGGACALSVLTEPENFDGGLQTLSGVAEQVNVPILMKDVVVSVAQLEAGAQAGADAVVLISEVFNRGLADLALGDFLGKARELGMEVLAEANGVEEFLELRKFEPDLYGVNNRNLSTFQLELSTTETILDRAGRMDRPVVSESGIESADDVRRLKSAGATAFLVGTSIMKSSNIEVKVRELVQA